MSRGLAGPGPCPPTPSRSCTTSPCGGRCGERMLAGDASALQRCACRSAEKPPQGLVQDAQLGSPPAPASRPVTELPAPERPVPGGRLARARAPRPSTGRLGRGRRPPAPLRDAAAGGADTCPPVPRGWGRLRPARRRLAPGGSTPAGLDPSGAPTAPGAAGRREWGPGCVQAGLRPHPHDGRPCALRCPLRPGLAPGPSSARAEPAWPLR